MATQRTRTAAETAKRTNPGDAPGETFQVTVDARGWLRLPSRLWERLGLEPGDALEIGLAGDGRATLGWPATAPAPPAERAEGEAEGEAGAEAEPAVPLRGILLGDFKDWDDIQQFIAEERRGWEDREPDPTPSSAPGLGTASTPSSAKPSPPADPSASTAPR